VALDVSNNAAVRASQLGVVLYDLHGVPRMRLTHVSAPASENSADSGRVGSRAPSVHRGEGQR